MHTLTSIHQQQVEKSPRALLLRGRSSLGSSAYGMRRAISVWTRTGSIVRCARDFNLYRSASRESPSIVVNSTRGRRTISNGTGGQRLNPAGVRHGLQ